MKILSLDTGGAQACFAAVELDAHEWKAQREVSCQARTLEQSRRLSRDIMLEIAAALAAASWTLGDLDAVAAGLGPGSWTGLRIGLTTAKTLAQARELPLIGVPTFDALAAGVHGPALSVAVAPCRAGEIYAKLWRTGAAGPQVLRSEHIVAISEGAAQIAAIINEAALLSAVLVCPPEGQGAARQIADALAQSAPGCALEIVETAPQCTAQNIAVLAARRLQNGERDDALTLSPLYLAPSNAERNLAEKQARQR